MERSDSESGSTDLTREVEISAVLKKSKNQNMEDTELVVTGDVEMESTGLLRDTALLVDIGFSGGYWFGGGS